MRLDRESGALASAVGEPAGPRELVCDKEYHSNATRLRLRREGVRSYVSEPKRGLWSWRGKEEERRAVVANRRRVRGEHGKRLLRRRGELVERSFAHGYETGGMRRLYLRGRGNIGKRLLIQAAGFDLGLLMRHRCGIGKPRRLQGRAAAFGGALFALIFAYRSREPPAWAWIAPCRAVFPRRPRPHAVLRRSRHPLRGR